MGWIKNRIRDEKRKHSLTPFGEAKRDIDWARLAEGKIVMSILEHCWKNNSVPYADLHNLDCECGHSLLYHEDVNIKDMAGKHCKHKFCTCQGFKKKDISTRGRLASTDGGWVNCLWLSDYLKGSLTKGCGNKIKDSMNICGVTRIWDVTTTMTTKYCESCE